MLEVCVGTIEPGLDFMRGWFAQSTMVISNANERLNLPVSSWQGLRASGKLRAWGVVTPEGRGRSRQLGRAAVAHVQGFA